MLMLGRAGPAAAAECRRRRPPCCVLQLLGRREQLLGQKQQQQQQQQQQAVAGFHASAPALGGCGPKRFRPRVWNWKQRKELQELEEAYNKRHNIVALTEEDRRVATELQFSPFEVVNAEEEGVDFTDESKWEVIVPSELGEDEVLELDAPEPGEPPGPDMSDPDVTRYLSLLALTSDVTATRDMRKVYRVDKVFPALKDQGDPVSVTRNTISAAAVVEENGGN